MVDKIRVNHVLQIAASIVREEDVNGLRGWIGSIARDGVVDSVDYIRMRRKEGVCFDFLESERDRLLTEGTSYLLKREQFVGRRVFNKVDV